MKQRLSIDVEAHLQKIATHTFGSRHHYPVELVRLALSRGANRVQVTIKPTKLEILDDGKGIDKKDLAGLQIILDRKRGAQEREQAILKFKTARGIGLLVLFAPGPQKIVNVTVEPQVSNQLTTDLSLTTIFVP